MLEARGVRFPGAEVEVKIVPTIAQLGGAWRGGGHRLCEWRNGVQHAANHADQNAGSNTPNSFHGRLHITDFFRIR
jgi:hypothetical protein